MSSLVPVSSSMYRVLVADVLPFEHPVFFNNRYFVRLLKSLHVEMDESSRLFSCKAFEGKKKDTVEAFLEYIQNSGQKNTECYQYEISKDDDDENRTMRKLTIIHPYDQIKMAYFYKKYQSIILDFCSRSNFSLRYPYKVATHHRKDKGYPHYISDEEKVVEPDEGQRHYFAYRRFKNINNFYESFEFLNAERSYSCMQKLDIKHCFDNIHPDILAKALYDTDINSCQQTIAADFGNLMKNFKAKGDGIIIGPEFSRLFSEILMQRIDNIVEKRMRARGYNNKRDYTFYRYVDDGFLFYDEEEVRGFFEYIYTIVLREYGLSLNKKASKYINYGYRPFLEGITAAKIGIRQLVKETFANRLNTLQGILNAQIQAIQSPLFLDYQNFISKVRAIVFEHGILFKDITTFTLGQIKVRVEELLKNYNGLLKEYTNAENFDSVSEITNKAIKKYYTDFEEFSSNLTEALFYLASCDLRMSTTVKVIAILNRIQLFVRGKYKYENYLSSVKFPSEIIDDLDSKITLELTKIFKNSRIARRYPLEALNFLELEKKMGDKNKVSPKILFDYVKDIKCDFNFFTIFEILHFTRLDSKYSDVNELAIDWLTPRLEREATNTEDFYSQLEFLSLYSSLTERAQKKLKDNVSKFDKKVVQFVKTQRHMFINWDKYDLFSELGNLNSEEVY